MSTETDVLKPIDPDEDINFNDNDNDGNGKEILKDESVANVTGADKSSLWELAANTINGDESTKPMVGGTVASLPADDEI